MNSAARMQSIIIILAGLGSAAVFSPQVHADNVNPTVYDLYQQCQNNEPRCGDYLRGAWDAWLAAIFDASIITGNPADIQRIYEANRLWFFCPPPGPVPAGHLSLVYQKWVRDNPKASSVPAYVAAWGAFKEGYPCRDGGPRPMPFKPATAN
jgi:hypothetical protein